jgi:hypothetical protein
VGNRVEIDADLEARVTEQIVAPMVAGFARAIAEDVKLTGPIDTGLLRILADSEPAHAVGSVAVSRMVSSRPTDDGRADAAVWVEFGTRYMTPRRYSAASSQRVIARMGYGRFDQASDPWPHK